MRYLIYAGVKGGPDRCGIHSFSYDDATHVLEWRKREDTLRGFTHLAISQNGLILEATGKDDQHEDILVGFSIDPVSGELCRTGVVRLSTSSDVCHLDISHDGSIAVVTDFIDKGVHFWQLSSDGAPVEFLGRVPFYGSSTSYRQGSSHPHSAFFSKDDRYVFVSDLGANCVWTLWWNKPKNRFEHMGSWKGRDGLGQRHVAIHPSGRFIYALCEITAEVAALDIGQDGELRQISLKSAMDQPLPDYRDQAINDIGLPSNYIAAGDIVVSPDGRFVFISIRMIREISVFRVMPDGDLSPICFIPTDETVRCMKVGIDSKTLFAFNEESSFTGGHGKIEVFVFDDSYCQLERVARIDVPGTFVGAVLPEKG